MSYLDKLDDFILSIIITKLYDANSIINFKESYNRSLNLMSQFITYLSSDDMISNIKLMDILSFSNLIIVSHNITINIDNVDDMKMFNIFRKLKHINIYIGVFKYIDDTIQYLDEFLKTMHTLSDKTFRIFFNIDDEHIKKHAYIIDRGYVSIANFKQLRIDSDEVLDKISKVFLKYFPKYDTYTCIYTTDEIGSKIPTYKSLFYKDDKKIDLDLLDVEKTKHIIDTSIIFLINVVSKTEIYYPTKYVNDISIIMGKRATYINYTVAKLLINLYAEKCNIIDDKLYIKVWNDKIFTKYYNKGKFLSVYNAEKNSDNKMIVKEFIDNKVELSNFVHFIMEYCYPVDENNVLHNILLPQK